MKIALVDDERIYLDEMQKLCLEFAAQHTIQPEIFRFSSSEDFLKSWQPGFYSIIFLDIFMKNGNGIETAQKLREGNDNSLLVSSHPAVILCRMLFPAMPLIIF